ncbi:hypothetical protein, partial [Porphyromonas sp.]|uniref:hypothetical protein n=1 Tax=Porphyromonas sp. TaxID=1924944 RepID=UPI00257B6449
LRHSASSSLIRLFEEAEQALRLIVSIPLVQRRKSVLFTKEKAPSRNGFSASMYVVLKIWYVNPNIYVRGY